jgi:hypothetical protein
MISCQEIFFSGEEGRRDIKLESFHTIEISGIYNIILVQDSTDHLVITGQNNIGSINAAVNGDTLDIINRKKMTMNADKNTLEIHFSTVERIVTLDPVDISGQGTIKSENLYLDALGEIANMNLAVDCKYFQLVNSGNTLGNFIFKGKAGDCYIFNRYGCRVFADSLICRSATVLNESVGDVRISALENIQVFIQGPGNILYHGSPYIQILEKRGTGRVIHIDE